MQVREYGTAQKDSILLLHGGGLSWWNYRETANRLKNEYHIIMPILDGHAGCDRPFTTIEDNAAEIINWIDEYCGGYVLMIGGLSLGAQILLEILSERHDICTYALAESAAVIPSGLASALIAPLFGSCHRLIQNRTFAGLQFKSLHIKQELFDDYYRDTCQIPKTDMITFIKASTSYALNNKIQKVTAELHIFWGSRESNVIKRSAETIGRMLPDCKLHCMSNFRHGELSLNHADLYADAIRQIINGGYDQVLK